ncbi:MAG: hypothetical protein R6U27_15265 [Desulfobacterales bacterium]
MDYSTLNVIATQSVQYSLAVNSSGASEVGILSSTEHGGTTNYSRTVNQGITFNLEAPQYHGSGSMRKLFTDWPGAVSSTHNSITFTIDENKTVTAMAKIMIRNETTACCVMLQTHMISLNSGLYSG